jgi:alpha-tubulin suppressor-like RCC1 family protein
VQGAVEITAGSDHTCALIDDGSVTCWGQNGGRLGNGVDAAYSPPMTVVGLDGVVSVSAGDAHTCAVLEDGTARCWGGNSDGQLGNGSTAFSAVPVAVSGLTGALSISAGGSHTCALRASGLTRTVRCWGANDLGQLGNGTTTASSVPVTVPGLTSTFVGPAAVAAATVSTCALLDDGTARCWGDNGDGQLGNGSFANTATPVLVNGLTGVASLDTRFINTCATVTSGEVRCWGANQAGQLGNGTASAPSTVAVPVMGLRDAVGVSVGSSFACAARTTGAVVCWGDNDFGRLGDGSGTDSPVPVPVATIP